MVIEFESVNKTFRDGTQAVADLSLTVPSNKITVVVGPSGCGKTTTLRMVNRMIEPSKGRITWDGSPLRSRRKTALRRQMGYVIQSGGLFPHRTVIDNIGTVPGLLGWSRGRTQQRSLELLAAVGLDRTLADRYPAQLSGGQQQRVGVARALAADPMVLLMDEPFSAVDPVVRGELHEFFLTLQRELGKTIVLITHDIDEAVKLGDQVAILRVGGRLAQVGSPQEVLEHPADAFVEGFVGRDRGYRSLAFVPASTLSLDGVPVVRDVASAAADSATLVLDGDARPTGWVEPGQGGRLRPLGSTFDAVHGTLRSALDAALTSPVGMAVAVDAGTGRYAGVVPVDAIVAAVAQVRQREEGLDAPVVLTGAPAVDEAFDRPAEAAADAAAGADADAAAGADADAAAGADADESDEELTLTRIRTSELGEEAGQDVDHPTDPSAADEAALPPEEQASAEAVDAATGEGAPAPEPDEPEPGQPEPEDWRAEEAQPSEETPPSDERAQDDRLAGFEHDGVRR